MGAIYARPLISLPDDAAQVFKDLPNIKQLTLANLNDSLAVVHGPAPSMDFWILTDSAKGLWVKQYPYSLNTMPDFNMCIHWWY